MGKLYEIDSNKGILIYTNQNQIIIRSKNGQFFAKPIVLANDYKSSLSETIYDSTLYFTYINTSNNIVIRSLRENTFPYIIAQTFSTSLFSPTLLTFCDELVLFYIIYYSEINKYSICGILPFKNHQKIPLNATYDSHPVYFTSNNSDLIILSIICSSHCEVSLIDNAFNYSCFYSKNDEDKTRISEYETKISEYEAKINEYETKVSECETKVSECEAIISEYGTKISEYETKVNQDKKMADLLNTDLTKYKNENIRLMQTIESIKNQYSQLMDVATKYKEEAAKWNKMYMKLNDGI